jgi:purine-nucleoside phosphorylase
MRPKLSFTVTCGRNYIDMSLYDKIQATAAYIQSKVTTRPQVGIILGSGLGGLIDLLDKEAELAYTDIPDFPVST